MKNKNSKTKFLGQHLPLTQIDIGVAHFYFLEHNGDNK